MADNSVHVNTSNVSPKVIAFRDLLRSKFPAAHKEQQPETEAPLLGIPCLDAVGLAKGAITEIVGSTESCGVGLLIAALLQRKTTIQEGTALIDARNAFDPWSVEESSLDRLLWVRCREVSKAMRVTDLLLRDGNLPLVILDLQGHSAREVQAIPASSWHRLRVLAEQSSVVLCAFTPCITVPCARTRLLLEQRFTLDALESPRTDLLARLSTRVGRQAPGKPLHHEELRPAMVG